MYETVPIYPLITQTIVYELGIETTKILNERQDKLKSIKWTNGEANLDTEYSKLACDCCIMAWDTTMKIKYTEYSEIDIICIIPDINITFTYSDGRKTKYKIELKSSKSKKMPASTIKKLDINQTLIYCLRPSTNSESYKLKCSQYHSAMGDSDIDLFQDRTPRPFINFEKMNEMNNTLPFESIGNDCWINHYAKCALNRINESISCQKSWQDDMIKIIKKQIIEDYVRNTLEEQFQKDKIYLQVENANI